MTTTITEFDTEHEAREYRYTNATGGWIFVPEDGGKVLLFSPEIYPHAIFHHPITKGRTGKLVGTQ